MPSGKKNITYNPIDTAEQLNYFQNQIDGYIRDFCLDHDIDNLKTESQNVFNACLRYIYNHTFKPGINNKIIDRRYNSLLDYNNPDLIYGILIYYIYICDLYNKAISINSFATLIGIDNSVIYDWINGVNRADNPIYSNIGKILIAERERTLSDKLISNSKSPIGLLGVLNHENGWNLPGSTKEIKHVAAVETPESIAERYKSRLSDRENVPLLSDDSAGNDAD